MCKYACCNQQHDYAFKGIRHAFVTGFKIFQCLLTVETFSDVVDQHANEN
ncbi:Uncharacterised protein [Vibrio cholerae]|nr:Uncharacterised protein [Vibrio cholerae]CSI57569.1 Uncharacterised protein [Vibrio cholerae]